MVRLIDADKLNRKDVNCANVPMNFIDTAPTVEAIPKADYEARLKADMVAILTEIQLEIEETYETDIGFLIHDETKRTILNIIDKYKAESEDKE